MWLKPGSLLKRNEHLINTVAVLLRLVPNAWTLASTGNQMYQPDNGTNLLAPFTIHHREDPLPLIAATDMIRGLIKTVCKLGRRYWDVSCLNELVDKYVQDLGTEMCHV